MKQTLCKKFLAFVLIFGLLLPTAADIVVNAVPFSTTSEISNENPETSDDSETVKPIETVSVYELTRDSQILKHIDEDVLTANNHVARLTEEETLSSYVFLNSDGSKTVYYMDKEVKFLDQNGKIVEKDVSLTNTLGGFTTVSNDIGLLLPDNPANGINMTYNNYTVTIVPEGSPLRRTAQSNDSSVIYPDYFGSGMSLMYTPSLDGLKEDIVLSRYTGVTTFVFRLLTDGLQLLQENNRYYLAQSDTEQMRIDMGDVVAFDARGRFSVGTMDVTTVNEGQEYLLTLSVDEAFLTDETTTYPVSIAPTLTVSDNTHGAGAIEDITIYSGTPNANCDWPYLHCGYYNSTYKVARTMFRLTGLLSSSEYQSMNAGNITSAYFHIQEATGTAALPVHIYSNTGNATWTETGATWNNAGHTLGTIYATVSPGVNQAVSYNITNLVKAWKNNQESAQAGFVLVSSNETSLDKAFYSSETTTTSYRSYVVVNYQDSGTGGGDAFSESVSLSLNTTVSVSVAYSNEKRYFSFTPSVTDFYTIESSGSGPDPCVWLYSPNHAALLAEDDDSTGTYNFRLTYHLVAGATYYIAAGCSGGRTGTYSFTVTSSASGTPSKLTATTISQTRTPVIVYAYASLYYQFIAPNTGKYIFQSSNSAGDPRIWLYDSNFVSCGTNDDSGGNRNFRLEVMLNAGVTYYIAVGHFGSNTGTYGFNILIPVAIPNEINHLRNAGTALYLDLPGPDEPQYPYQCSVHKSNSERWSFQQQSNGYYTIQSQFDAMYYLGINNTNVNTDNVVMRSTVSDYTLWNIYETANGLLLIEPKMSMGTVLCVPNTSEGTALQLCWMSSDVAGRNRWQIGIQWDIELEGQQMNKWCWATAARMFASNYSTIPNARTQSAAVQAVKGSVINNGGTLAESIQATNYYGSGSIDDSTPKYVKHNSVILQESILRRYLDDGHCVHIARGWYDKDNVRSDGHAYVIVGYSTFVENRTLQYEYVIFDPWPAIPPNPWPSTPTATTGNILQRSYEWICNGRNVTIGDGMDTGIWDGFIVVKTDYSDYVLPPKWNE